ncbi:glycosyltransferase family 2 protein [Nonlabens xiamenensis]|uniref:glycosyltransferase family 2 protein n=1 Tax=Nonlabens xiamenensis TaxID=2341043 RepID=UPI000F611687|nr:glycosyltransferase family 2 protein [Nonlabens xiamenensis]
MNKLVSIIIPVYNRGHLIGETLASILKQSYTHWECIIVDDHSSDNTVDVVESYVKKDDRIHLYKRDQERPKGANACRNIGFEKSTGIYINFFDSDDLMHPDKLLLQVQHLNHHAYDFNVCQTLVFEGKFDGNGTPRSINLHSDDPFNDYVSHRIKWLTQAPLIKKEVLINHKILFDEHLHQSQELDMFGRLLAQTTNYGVVDQALVFFRKHDQSISHGPASATKLASSFRVRYQFVTGYPTLTTPAARRILIKELIGLFVTALKQPAWRKSQMNREMYAQLRHLMPEKKQLWLLKLIYFSFQFTGKGEVFKGLLLKSI